MTVKSQGPWRLKPLPAGALARHVRRFYLEWLVLACVSMAGLAWLTLEPVVPAIGQAVYDALHRLNPPEPSENIVIVAVDDRSLQELGGWPLSRSVYAQLLRQLADTHNEPRSIGFDVLFLDPRAQDSELAHQMRRHHVVLPVELQSQGAERTVRAPAGELPLAAKALGHIQVTFESDGALRGLHLHDHSVPHLVLAMTGQTKMAELGEVAYRRFRLVDPGASFKTVSLADLLLGRYPLSELKDRHVLIGATAPSLGDHYPSIYAGRLSAGMPGVELHASALNAILGQRLIEPASRVWQLGLGAGAVLLVLFALLIAGPLAQLLWAAGCILALLLASQGLMNSFNLWFDPGPAWVIIALLKPAWAWRRTEMTLRFMSERAEQLDATIHPPGRGRKQRASNQQVTDMVMRYSRILDEALDVVKLRLSSLSAIVQGAPNAMLVLDEDRTISMLNLRMKNLLPAPWVQEGAMVDALMQHLGWPADQELEALIGLDHYVSSQLAGEESRHYLVNVIRLSSDMGRNVHLVSLVDITDLRALQSQRERTLQLLSHDMRTPVASILALSQDAAHEAERKIQRHAHTLLEMMDDFILSIQAQEHQYVLVETLFDDLLDEAIYQVKDLAQSKGMAIDWRGDESGVFVLAAPRLMIRVLVNVLVNAIRHGQGGSTIEIRFSQEQDKQTRHEPPWLCCVVRNRIGMLQPQTASASKGFGLGTVFVEEVVRKHHGQVLMDVGGEVGAWAQVTCRLPVVVGSRPLV